MVTTLVAFGQFATGFKLLEIFFARGGNIDRVTDDIHAARIETTIDTLLQICEDFRRLELVCILIDADFNAGVLQIEQSIDCLLQWQVSKTFSRRGNQHE